MNSAEMIIKRIQEENIRFIRLQFCDIFGGLKSITITASQMESAVNNDCMFDGSSIEGFARIEESDMVLRPDLSTLVVLPWTETTKYKPESYKYNKTASIICDVYTKDGIHFEGDPRFRLKKAIKNAKKLGYKVNIGSELEFFLFELDEQGLPTTANYDTNGYFDLSPTDRGDECRKQISNVLEKMGFFVEASHHECAPAQHEIDFRYTEALCAADDIMRFKLVTKTIANENGFYASFMPKPMSQESGNGMHINISLHEGNKNVFSDENSDDKLSTIAKQFIAGLLIHSKAITAIANPLVNSYKRLVRGYEAPTMIAWSTANRSPLIRVPSFKSNSARFELRSPDSSCNPYLALAVCIEAGLDGIQRGLIPPEEATKNLFEMTKSELMDEKIESLPSNLYDAIAELKKDELIRGTIGEYIYNVYHRAKLNEWENYNTQVTHWEMKEYFGKY